MGNDEFYLQAVLSAEDDAITIINEKKEVIFWNEAAVRTYNIEKKEILHKKITDFFKDDHLMVLKVLQTKEHVENQYHRPRADKHVVVNAMPIFNEHQEIIGAVSVERDISQIVKLNDHLVSTSIELNELRQKVYTSYEETPFSKLKGKSRVLQETIRIAAKAAKTDALTLILGESGTGKEICARAIHEASVRKNGPFIPVNCGSIPSALFESELFGYEAGTFTGAEKKGKGGKIEEADGGTLFLDEIGELPLDMQVKLLRVLQENVIYRIGDATGRKVNVRFIAATNQNLQKMMEEKRFRSDLYYRLNVIQITMPPLRKRIEDIPILAGFFLKQFAIQYKVPEPELLSDAVSFLLQYRWPGNVRELRNLMERIVILSEKQVIHKEALLQFFQNPAAINNTAVHPAPHSLPEEKKHIEKQLIEKILKEVNGNKSAAARKLGISRVTLYQKLKKYGADQV
ncbi:sigma-54 interaction domain-containing protein [Heyndrickxia acidiproducens]|uniref:sigma-54 interaction domain-containing protein n=1 Tax=Heyndrickxia acidiproducens TaxID=1121084 RepID=UPI000363282E|nr:sigma-54-dependent Fis family transcriptional regulator [Heyndrickxia acidiproducens]